jgi:hypothetical protein
MSRVQSFTSMVAWRKSECCNVLMKIGQHVERLKSAEQFRPVSRLPDYLRIFTSRSAMRWTSSMMSRTAYRHGTWFDKQGIICAADANAD